ncbi:MAG: preprotein translocase subunit SecE [Gemmatimonadales bacterium]
MEQVQVPERSNRVVGWFRQTRDFFVAVRAELSKVSWPTQKELIKATRMVVVLTLILGIVLGLVDLLLTKVLIDGVAALSR